MGPQPSAGHGGPEGAGISLSISAGSSRVRATSSQELATAATDPLGGLFHGHLTQVQRGGDVAVRLDIRLAQEPGPDRMEQRRLR